MPRTISEKSPLVEMNERKKGDNGTFTSNSRQTPSSTKIEIADEEAMAITSPTLTSAFTQVFENVFPVKQPEDHFATNHSPFYHAEDSKEKVLTNKDISTFDHLLWSGYGMTGSAIAGAQAELAQEIKQMGEVDISRFAQERFDEILTTDNKGRKKTAADFSNTRSPSPDLENMPLFPFRGEYVFTEKPENTGDSVTAPPSAPKPTLKKRKKRYTYKDPAAMHREDKYPILIQTMALVGLALAGKYWLHMIYGFEGYISLGEIGMVFTGLFFIQGIVFGSATSDLKSAQALPGQVVVILEEIEDHFMYNSRKVISKNLTLSYSQSLIKHFAEKWREYLLHQKESSYWHCELILREIVLLAALWDSKGGSLSKVPELVGKLRDPLSSAAFIHRAEYLPATQILLLFFVTTASILMMLVKFNSLTVMFGVTASVLTVIWFTLRLIKALRNPFNVAAPQGYKKWLNGYMAAVQLFQLNEYIEKVGYRQMVQKRREALLYGVRISNYWDSATGGVVSKVTGTSGDAADDGSDNAGASKSKDSNQLSEGISIKEAFAARKAFGKWRKTALSHHLAKSSSASSPTYSATATASNIGSFNNDQTEDTN